MLGTKQGRLAGGNLEMNVAVSGNFQQQQSKLESTNPEAQGEPSTACARARAAGAGGGEAGGREGEEGSKSTGSCVTRLPSVQPNRLVLWCFGWQCGWRFGGGGQQRGGGQATWPPSGMRETAVVCGGACEAVWCVRVSPVWGAWRDYARCGISQRIFTIWERSDSREMGFITYLLPTGGE